MENEEIRHLSRLCRIALSDEEVEALRADLEHILGYIETLQEVDTSALSPRSHLQEHELGDLRDDEPCDFPQEKLLKNAPDRIGPMIRTPSVIQKEGPK